MEGLLLIVVLTSVFLLHDGAEVPIQPDFDFKKMAGKWHSIAVVLSILVKIPSDPVNLQVMPSGNGDLVFKQTSMKNEKCVTHYSILYHTDEAGKFLNRDKTNTIRMVDVNYDSYFIFHVTLTTGGALHLYTRSWDGIDEVKEKFQTFATDKKFLAEQISFTSEESSCPA